MNRQSFYGVVGLLFVVSGAVGLVYQIVWFKYISLFLGNTMYAQTIVVATFMGGLAIGATLWGRKADRSENALTLYGRLEFFIGLYCLVYPQFLGILKGLFVSVVVSAHLPTDGSGVLLLKLLTSLLTLLPPTILMGGTLPVLVRFISERIEDATRNVALLYFLNSFGAVVGSILGGFFLVAMLGLSTSIYVTASLNIAVGVTAILLGRIRIESTSFQSVPDAPPAREFSSLQQCTALIVAGVSGFAAMIYEVGWVRLFLPVLGSSTYSFTLMLVGFISGITLGSLIVANAERRIRNMFGFLALCQLGVVISMIAVLPLYGRIPYYFWIVAHTLNRSELTYPIFLAIEFAFGFAVMVVPTIFLGMSLPMASRIAAKNFRVLGKSVGNVFSVNTFGTVIGTLIAGFVLMPIVGVERTIETGVVINLVLGMVVLLVERDYQVLFKYVVAAVLLAMTGCYFILGPDWNRAVTLSGVFRQINRNMVPPTSYTAFQSMNSSKDALYYKDGASATVAVIESETLEGTQNVLYINGKADASSIADLPTQVLLGQLPSLLHPNPQSALVVGLGSGVTAGSILTHSVKSLDCVEISPEVVEAENYFEHVNDRPLADPRMRLYVEDALAFLQLTPHRYDFIVSEPSNPWIAGIGSLYTVEFFSETKKHLNNGGLMVQWFHLYEMDDETFKLVLRTFQTSFKQVSLWYSMVADIILVGSDQPIPFDYARIRERMQQEKVHTDLQRISITQPTTLLSLQALATRSVIEYTGGGPLNTEDHPYLEYWAPRTFFINRGVVGLSSYDERLGIVSDSIYLKKYLKLYNLSDEQMLEIGKLHSEGQRGYPPLGYSLLLEYSKRNPWDHHALDRLADAAIGMGYQVEAQEYRRKLEVEDPNNVANLEKYAWLMFTHERNTANAFVPFSADDAERLLKRCISLSADTVDRYRVRLADIYFSVQEYKQAANSYARALQIRETHEPDIRIKQDVLLLQFAKCLYHLGMRERAAGYAIQATWINPDNEDAKDLFYSIWASGGTVAKDTVR